MNILLVVALISASILTTMNASEDKDQGYKQLAALGKKNSSLTQPQPLSSLTGNSNDLNKMGQEFFYKKESRAYARRRSLSKRGH